MARQSGKRMPQVGIVILSMYDDEGFVLEVLTHSVSAYVLKGATSSELVLAVREVAAGRRYLSPPLSNQVIEAYRQLAQAHTLDRTSRLQAIPVVRSPPG